MEELLLNEVRGGVNRKLDLMKRFLVYLAVPRRPEKPGPHDGATQENGTQASKSAIRGEVVRKLPGCKLLQSHSWSRGHESFDGDRDISDAFINTSMPEGEPVYAEPSEGLYEHNDVVWCLKRALNGLRDASRLFHEHFADVLTSRFGFARSDAQPTLFVDLARNVFTAVQVDDLIMVRSVAQLYEVVPEKRQYFTMKVIPPPSANSPQTYVRARYTCDTATPSGELPTTQYVPDMLTEHGLKDAKPVVTPTVNRNDEDDYEEDANAEEHRTLRRSNRQLI